MLDIRKDNLKSLRERLKKERNYLASTNVKSDSKFTIENETHLGTHFRTLETGTKANMGRSQQNFDGIKQNAFKNGTLFGRERWGSQLRSNKSVPNSLEIHNKMQEKTRNFRARTQSDGQNINQKMGRSNPSFKVSYSLPNKSEEKRGFRIKTENFEKCTSRRERISMYDRNRIRYPVSNQEEESKYKNEKLNILVQDYLSIIKNIPEHMRDENRFGKDITALLEIFENLPNKRSKYSRHSSQRCKTFVGKLLFFIGYEICIKFEDEIDEELKNYEFILCNYFQIYFSMRLKTPLMVMECYLELIDNALMQKKYYDCEKFVEKCLLASIYYREKYYEERCIEKLSMCEYYKGNICEATYLHDNNGNLTSESIKNVRDGYNERDELSIVYHHLYETPKFNVKELLKDYEDENDTYKSLIVFKNPRVSIEDSMKNKQNQLKVDIRSMERFLEFKPEASRIKRELEKHEHLFNVVRAEDYNADSFRLMKRNYILDEENESSQILRAHQSLNRIKEVKVKPIFNKLSLEFIDLLKMINNKLNG